MNKAALAAETFKVGDTLNCGIKRKTPNINNLYKEYTMNPSKVNRFNERYARHLKTLKLDDQVKH
ncbi:hypothetical protein DO021_20915 [Desulfobacter hydrogenophilus]|uniref:Uncharacterized protein n=1 Tax=Desulfobacter hydrogenophilus TaxID=2291 RepID=A0A328FAJ8_9BACT|nr:hypothetical protein DO021_20915 [Desulfobacter hydrogenophilus]